MKIIGSINRFNTGRGYSANRQPIVWAVVEGSEPTVHSRVVVFIDEARTIEGAIPLYVGNLDLIDDGWVLRAYDDHHYRMDYDAVQFLRQMAKG